MRLNIGAGKKIRKLDVCLDTRSPIECGVLLQKRNITWIIGNAQRLPFRDRAFSEIIARHIIEHFGWRETSSVIKEWLRVLKIGGILEIVCPNVESYCKRIPNSNTKKQEHLLRHLWGDQDYPGNFHLTGFTPKTLERIIRLAGQINYIEVGYLPIYGVKDAQIRIKVTK